MSKQAVLLFPSASIQRVRESRETVLSMFAEHRKDPASFVELTRADIGTYPPIHVNPAQVCAVWESTDDAGEDQ